MFICCEQQWLSIHGFSWFSQLNVSLSNRRFMGFLTEVLDRYDPSDAEYIVGLNSSVIRQDSGHECGCRSLRMNQPVSSHISHNITIFLKDLE